MAVVNSPPSCGLHASEDSTALQDDLLVALARSPSIDEATKQAIHKLKVTRLLSCTWLMRCRQVRVHAEISKDR